jgi:hypothetical protein
MPRVNELTVKVHELNPVLNMALIRFLKGKLPKLTIQILKLNGEFEVRFWRGKT